MGEELGNVEEEKVTTAPEEANLENRADDGEGDRDKAKKAQESRSKHYGIAIKEGGNVTKPSEFSDVPDSEFGDPVNYRYPMKDEAHANNASSRWGDASNREQYSSEEQGIISKRIVARQKHFGGETSKSKAAEIAKRDEGEPEKDTMLDPTDQLIREQVAILMNEPRFVNIIREMMAPESNTKPAEKENNAELENTTPEPPANLERAVTVDLTGGRAVSMYVPITRFDEETRIVEGVVSNEEVDTFGTVFDYDSMKKAIQQRWNKNMREQHNRTMAVGKGIEAIFDDDARQVILRSYVSKAAEGTWTKIKEGILNGYSIGAANAKETTRMVNGRPVTCYVDFTLPEISYVDAPSNPGAAKSGLTLYRCTDGGANVFSAELQEQEEPTETRVDEVQAVQVSQPIKTTIPSPVAQQQQLMQQNTAQATQQSRLDRMVAERVAARGGLGTTDETPLTEEEIKLIANGANPSDVISSVPDKNHADYKTIDAEMNNLVLSRADGEKDGSFHIHSHPYEHGDIHLNDHLHPDHEHTRSDAAPHSHPHMHSHDGKGDGTKPHAHFHKHDHNFQRSASDSDPRTQRARTDTFIGQERTAEINELCRNHGIEMRADGGIIIPSEAPPSPGTMLPNTGNLENGGPAQKTFDGQNLIIMCPQCQASGSVLSSNGGWNAGENCPVCGYVFVANMPIPSNVEEQPRSQKEEKTATQTPDLTRKGARLSSDSKTGIHQAISSLAHTCAGEDGSECKHCAAILAVLDPDNDNDDDLDENLDTDNDADELGIGRVQIAQITRAISEKMEKQNLEVLQRVLSPVITRFNAINAQLAAITGKNDTETKSQISELRGLIESQMDRLKSVEGLLIEVAESEKPGAPITRAVDNKFVGNNNGNGPQTPFTNDQLQYLRNLNLQQPPSASEQTKLAQEVFRRQFG